MSCTSKSASLRISKGYHLVTSLYARSGESACFLMKFHVTRRKMSGIPAIYSWNGDCEKQNSKREKTCKRQDTSPGWSCWQRVWNFQYRTCNRRSRRQSPTMCQPRCEEKKIKTKNSGRKGTCCSLARHRRCTLLQTSNCWTSASGLTRIWNQSAWEERLANFLAQIFTQHVEPATYSLQIRPENAVHHVSVNYCHVFSGIVNEEQEAN